MRLSYHLQDYAIQLRPINAMRVSCRPQHDAIKLPFMTNAAELSLTTRCAPAAMQDTMRSSYRP